MNRVQRALIIGVGGWLLCVATAVTPALAQTDGDDRTSVAQTESRSGSTSPTQPVSGAEGGVATASASTVPVEQPLVSNVFVETLITQALQDISLQAGVNILTDASVQGFVTLELDNVPVEEAIRMVLAPGGYACVKLDEKTYLVGKADRTSSIFHLLTKTESIPLRYVGADTIKQLLPEYYAPYVRFDATTNTVLIVAMPELLERIKQDVARIDRPPAQVEIQAIVTEISDEARRQLGLDWDWSWTPAGTGDAKYQSGFDSLQGILSGTVKTPYYAILAGLKRMVNSGEATVRANPRLVVLDGRSADIFVGEDRYFKIVTGTETTPFTRLEPIDVGVSLRITPRVAASREITLQVEVIVTDVTGQVGSDDLPVISRRQVTTSVRVKEGETLALGGLVQETQRTVTSKVPILGDLPVLRLLFSSERSEKVKSEVVVLIVPRLVEAES